MSLRSTVLNLGGALLHMATAIATLSPVQAAPPTARLGSEPVVLARMLADVQQGIALGDNDAFKRQSAIADDVDRRLRALPADTWRERRNRDALIKLVLSGSDPTLLGKVISAGSVPMEESSLTKGALAFATGDRIAAAILLSEVDHSRLAASLAGHVALVKAALAAADNPAEAMRLCLEARLLSPGTHVEEAALRLATELAIELGDEARFEKSALSYLFKFTNSVYARSIIPRIARVMGSIDLLGREKGRNLLAAVDARLSEGYLTELYLEMADGALRSGKLTTATLAGQKVLAAAPVGAAAAVQAKAVVGAARIAGGEIAEGSREMPAAEAVQSGTSLQALVDSAHRVADLLAALPERTVVIVPGRVAGGHVALAAAERSPELTERVGSVVSKVRARLAEVDKLMLEGPR
jgi:chemotaxis protein MotC